MYTYMDKFEQECAAAWLVFSSVDKEEGIKGNM